MAQQNTNFIRCTLNTGIGTGDTSIVVDAAASPWRTPPDPAGDTQTLVIVDDTLAPTKFEIIEYTGRTGSGPTYTLTGVTRAAQDGTDYPANTWTAGAYLVGDVTVDTVTIGDHATAANPHSGSAASGANSDITSLTGLTTDLTVAQGGTGRGTATAYGVICGGTTATGAHQSIASVGTSGQVLTSNGAGALPTMQDAAGGGGAWNLIQTQTISGTPSSVDFTTGIDSTYDSYMLILSNVTTNGGFLNLLVSTNAGSTWEASSYEQHVHRSWTSSSSYTGSGNTALTTGMRLCVDMGTTSSDAYSGMLHIPAPSNSSVYKIVSSVGGYVHTSLGVSVANMTGAWTGGTTAINGLRIAAGQLNSGNISLYGLSK